MAANKYAAPCICCGQQVPAGAGRLGKKDGRWTVEHDGDCPAPATAIAVETTAQTTFKPTVEQETALALYKTGVSMVIEAGAGAGKTSTLRLLAESDPSKTIKYLAFNKAIVTDVAGSMPSNVEARTAHSLAYQAIGKTYKNRMENSQRMTSERIATRLGIDPIKVGERTLAPGFLAGHVMRALTTFCQTAADKPSSTNFGPIDAIDSVSPAGVRSYANSNAVARELTLALNRAWQDVQNVDGVLPFTPAHYLKMWQLSHPHINADVIMFDEAQDASPVMAAIVAEQHHAQRVYVGDSAQAIYEWTGAVDAIDKMKQEGLAVATLSQSFRFGPAIAARANSILDELDADLRLVGTESKPSTVGPLDGEPNAILTRTNACAVDAILAAREQGVTAHLVGKGTEVLNFAKAVEQLQKTGTTRHPELACFASWEEVQRYVEEDVLGADLAMNVRLVIRYGVDTIREALEHMPEEADADLIISTAHKAKGREWDRVLIGADFAPTQKDDAKKPLSPAELRLRYVAITRAKLALDCTVLDEKGQAA